jgi:hypothetical protein
VGVEMKRGWRRSSGLLAKGIASPQAGMCFVEPVQATIVDHKPKIENKLTKNLP